MPKKRKRRKSTSSSEDDHARTSTKKTKKAKRKYTSHHSRERSRSPKTREDHRSRKDETQSIRQTKKLEKTRSRRAESPIFKEEERRNSKKSESKSSKHSSSKTSSRDKIRAQKRDILIPRSVSVAQKVQSQNESSRKKRCDVSETTSIKATEAKKPLLIPKDPAPSKKSEPEKQKRTYAKTSLKPATGVLPLHQHKILKASSIVPAQLPSKKTDVAEKFAKDYKISESSSGSTKSSNQNVKKTDSKPAFRNSFLPVDPSPSLTSNLLSDFKIPAVSVKTVAEGKLAKDKNKTLPVKSDDKALPVHFTDQLSSKTTATKTTTWATTATTSNLKTTVKVSPSQQRKTLKETSTVPSFPPPALLKFKIPKKKVVAEILVKDNTTLPIHSDQTSLKLESASSVTKHHESSMAISPVQNVQTQDPWISAANSFSSHAVPSPWQDQTQVVEELHQARSEKLLEVDVMQSYGELTCMEIDPPEEGATDSECKQLPQQDIIIVLDTNILLSHLDCVKKIVSRGLKGVGLPVVLIPWVVLQELDSLKRGCGLSGSVAHLAIPAISYIYNCLKRKESSLWGQSMQQAADSSNGLHAENNDDRILQCCLQYQRLYPECAVILCTNDKNLCSKALLSGVKAYSKNDLETEVARSNVGSTFLQNAQTSTTTQPHRNSISTLPQGSISVQTQEVHRQEAASLSGKEDDNPLTKNARRSNWHLNRLGCEFENCLQEALSNVLEAEMKAAFGDLWQEIVLIKPPWSLDDILNCLKKHWIAVFGHVAPRAKQQNVLNLIHFFSTGKDADQNSTLAALLDAKDLLKVFEKSSNRIPGALSVVNNILNTLQTQGEATVDDVVMNEAEDEKQTSSPQVSHSQVWALFENIWEHVYQASLSMFKALDFDPNAPVSTPPAGAPPPPQDLLLRLDQLICTVSQLLQTFSSMLTSPGIAEAQNLLSLMRSIQIADADKLAATDLLNCFSQQEYRERLRVGGNQLMEVRSVLERCLDINSHRYPAQP
ncbi:transcriptional protein SWT1 [Boleophthalmus pectinirostris]|uniref:transcriptional protein SWT1 n=1 Tax=Boleophthalmus pectinirostris TaxID=150288 RepID=UPI002432922B|nr:transcriptional protein SWT1 [Boleophthalmus pectinirostris]